MNNVVLQVALVSLRSSRSAATRCSSSLTRSSFWLASTDTSLRCIGVVPITVSAATPAFGSNRLSTRVQHQQLRCLGTENEDLSCRKHLEVPAEVFAMGCLLLQQAALGDLAEIEKLLLQNPSLVNFRDYDRRTALHVAAAEGHEEICKFLVDRGAIINRSDRWGASPLDDAHRHKQNHVLKYLRSKGGTSGSSSQTANFITAAAEGDIDEVRALLEFSTLDVNKGDYDRRTALHLAAGEGRPEIVQMLCEAGANVNVEDRWGKRPLDDANSSKQKECVEILTEYGAKKGSSIEVDSINSLIEAAAGGDVNTVKMLLELRNLNLNEGDYDHRTALHLAAGEGHDQIVELLLEAGAYPNSVDRWGNRPLDDAMNSKRASCMKILKAYGAKPGYSMNVEQEAVLDLLHEYATIRDGVPSLDWQDVKDLLKGIGHEPTDEVVKKLFEVADQCGSGIINTERFMEHSDTFLGGRPARIILVVGGPGSGKGLLCERLAKECGVVHLSSGALLRDEVKKGTVLGQEVESIMKSGGLVSSAMMVTLMNNYMKDHPGKRILLDGFPRSQENARDLVTLCGKPELALHLDCDDTILLERIMKRAQSGERADDNFQTAIQRIRTYHKYHQLTIDFLREEHVPIVNLDCSATPEGVWQQLQAIGRLMRPSVRLPTGNHVAESREDYESNVEIP